MAEGEVGHDVGVGKEWGGVEIAKGGGLDGAAQVNAEFFDGVGEVSDEDFANFVGAGLIENESEGAVRVMLANEDDGAVEK